MTSQEMKALGRVAVQAWNEGRLDLLDQVYAPTYHNHFNGETLDMLKQSLLATRAAFFGFTITIDDQIVEGDRGVTRWTARGVHTGEHLGVPATGSSIEITGTNIGRVEKRQDRRRMGAWRRCRSAAPAWRASLTRRRCHPTQAATGPTSSCCACGPQKREAQQLNGAARCSRCRMARRTTFACPIHLLAADADLGGAMDAQDVQHFITSAPHCRYNVLKRTGHGIHEERPDVYLQAVQQFMAEIVR